MSYDDFCRLTVDEFNEIWKAWNSVQEMRDRQDWERMRTLAVMTMQPHCKKKLTATKILPFPWDGRQGRRKKGQSQPLSKAQRKARFEKRMADLNMNTK